VVIILVLTYFVFEGRRTAQAERKKAEQSAEAAAIEAAKPVEIRGQVFLSLVGGGAVKLAGVEVLVVSADEAAPIRSAEGVLCKTAISNLTYWVARRAEWSQKVYNEQMSSKMQERALSGIGLPQSVQEQTATTAKRKRLDPLIKEADQIEAEISQWNTPQFLLPGRWRDIVTSGITDADGWFTIRVPKQGRFYVTAMAERVEGSSVMHYGWLLPLERELKNQLFLNNNNRLTLPIDLAALAPAK
jgi:hypothetical protein